MQRRPRYRWPTVVTRLMVLALVTALSTNSLLAAVGAGTHCDRRCGCCTESPGGPATTIRSDNGTDGCCGPAQAAPCRMSTSNLPVSTPALLSANDHHRVIPGHPLLTARLAGALPESSGSSPPWIDTEPAYPSPPLFLQTSRLIC